MLIHLKNYVLKQKYGTSFVCALCAALLLLFAFYFGNTTLERNTASIPLNKSGTKVASCSIVFSPENIQSDPLPLLLPVSIEVDTSNERADKEEKKEETKKKDAKKTEEEAPIITALQLDESFVTGYKESLKKNEGERQETEEPRDEDNQISVDENKEVDKRTNGFDGVYITEDEYQYLACIVMGETGGDDYTNALAVSQCLRNAMKKDHLNAYEVKRAYQYSGYNSHPNKSCYSAVLDVFYNGVAVTDEPILYFYEPTLVRSDWHESQTYVMSAGGHRFFKANGT